MSRLSGSRAQGYVGTAHHRVQVLDAGQADLRTDDIQNRVCTKELFGLFPDHGPGQNLVQVLVKMDTRHPADFNALVADLCVLIYALCIMQA